MSGGEKKGSEGEEVGGIQVLLGLVDPGEGPECLLGVMEAIGGL